MRTLILNGSPRKNGDTVAILKAFTNHIHGEVITINAYYDNIAPCNDCRACWKRNGCIIDDKMQEVYKLLGEVDNLIIASPLYFSQLTGKLLSLVSRLQCYYAKRVIRKEPFMFKEKKGILLITGGGDGGEQPAIDTANIIFRQTNTKVIGTVLSLNTDTLPGKDDEKSLADIKAMAEELNKEYASVFTN